MNNKNKIKLIASGITLCCCAAAVGAVSVVSSRNGGGVAPAAILQDEELPVVILDAGHGGFDGGCVSADGTPANGIN